MPEFGKHGVVPLTKEKDNEADNKECHEAAFHDICLGKLDWVELLFRLCLFGSNLFVEL